MPRGDGTGPMGTWTNCSGRPVLGRGAGRALGAGRGAGRGLGMRGGMGNAVGVPFGVPTYSAAEEKAILEDSARLLENELASIKAQLANKTGSDAGEDT